MAQKDKIQFAMPDFKIQWAKTSRTSISEEDLKKMLQAYHQKTFEHHPSWQDALYIFIVACGTGLRISDLQRLDKTCIKDGFIKLIPHKTRKKQKTVTVPLLDFIENMLEERSNGKYFPKFTQQTLNEKLKLIAQHLDIKTNLSINVGRHTFATLFLQKGGQTTNLMEMLGHSSITTTMNYITMDKNHNKKEINRTFGTLFKVR